MKKILISTLLSVAAVAAYAQGTVNFLNDTVTLSPNPDRFVRFAKATTPGNVFGTNNAPGAGTQFKVQLYFGASTAADSALIPVSTAPANLRVSTSGSVGVWQNGGLRTLTGFDYGSGQVRLQVRVFDSSLGSTFESTFAQGLGTGGVSTSFLYTIPASAGAPGSDFIMANFAGFTIDAVPEPSTIALAGLGAAALLIFRRRK